MIEQSVIYQITQASSIVEVLGEFIVLKKKGSNYMGLCPFHNEKTPSFTISPSREIYKCFGCGKSGNVVNFLMDYQKMNYIEALKWLAQKYNIEIIEKDQSPEYILKKTIQDKLFLLNEWAKKYFIDQLQLTKPDNNFALNYLTQRGFELHTIHKFQLGFAPKNVKYHQIAQKNGFENEVLHKAGLMSHKNGSYFDTYQNRIIFPIQNLSHKTLGFGARTLDNNESIPKYLNSPENEIFIKNTNLYGLNFARQSIIKENQGILVEGYTDVISLHQAGVENVFSSSGTSLTSNQLKLIKKFSSNLIIIYDGDAAGIKAAIRGLDLALEEELNVNLVLLPSGEDPDSFVNNVGAMEFKKYISQNQQDFVLFLTNLYLPEIKQNINRKNEVVNDLAEMLSKINRTTNFIKQEFYIKQCSTLLDIPLQSFSELVYKNDYNKSIKKNLNQKDPKISTDPMPTKLDSTLKNTDNLDEIYEKELLFEIIDKGQNPWNENLSILDYILGNIKLFPFINTNYLYILKCYCALLKEKKDPNFSDLLSHPDIKLRQAVTDLLSTITNKEKYWKDENKLGETTNKNLIQNNINNLLSHYLRFKIRYYINKNQENMRNIKSDNKDIVEYLNIHKGLKDLEKQISQSIESWGLIK